MKIALERPVKRLKNIKKTVKPILKNVKLKGDRALIKYTLEYDHVQIDNLVVSPEEIQYACEQLSEGLKNAIHLAAENIRKFHAAQIGSPLEVETMPGVVCQRKSVPIEKIGLYIPGGTAPLFSTVLMLAIPAKLSGCKELVLCTPPNKSGKIHAAILYCAQLTGIDRVVKVGGAQAIAALAYGTESVPQVYKIFGPGNQYVTAAKQIVAEKGIAIDLPAGPSEVAVFADDTAIPEFVATDLLSQAEHGGDSQVIMITTSEKMANSVMASINEHLLDLPRKKIAEKALEESTIIIIDTEAEAVDILNQYAAEHVILAIKNPDEVAGKIINAGSVFLGNYSPESAGDYASGPNHTLPTNKAALAYSGVSIDSFVKKITYQKLSEAGIQKVGPAVAKMAAAEGLMAHKRAITVRLDYLKKRNGNK
ncbi:MAG: histidinol dehydrogenase [Cyclobacteriaceae bacterium]|nr:histidinol dehydrogenase [Cyclobacteriaceae bacterium]